MFSYGQQTFYFLLLFGDEWIFPLTFTVPAFKPLISDPCVPADSTEKLRIHVCLCLNHACACTVLITFIGLFLGGCNQLI